MAALPICDELRRSVGKSDWEPQFILRCRREISKDLRLARKINALCMRLTASSALGFFWTADGWSKRDLFADFSRFVLASFWSFERSVIVAWVDGGVPDVDRYIHPFLLHAVQRDGETTKEVGEDLARVREYRGVVFGLNIGMRRREECIEELKALGDCHDVIETVRFMERLQQDDIEKRDRSLLLMREMEIPKVYTMDKRPLIIELRYKADSSDWCDVLTYLCREAADEDRSFTTKLNRLREEMLIICEKRRNIADELRSVRGIVVVQKAAEFVAETVRKDNLQAAQLREIERQMESRALEKELHVGYAHGMPLPRELADATGSTDVKDQLRRDAYIEEFQRLEMYNSSDEVIETIEILKGMQVDDMEKASRLILMAREIRNRVYQIYDFITKLRQ
ncbi:hypothetical protein Tco_1096027 [Tanacetum coccineum]